MTKTTPPSILVIVLNYRTAALSLVAAQHAVAAMEGLRGAVRIVDNASGDGSAEIIEAGIAGAGWERVSLIKSPRNGGFGAGNNLAMRMGLPDGSAPDYIYLLNSDAKPRADAIRLLMEALEAAPEAGIAGSRTVGADGVLHRTAFRFPSILGEFEGSVRTGLFTRLLRDWVVPLPVPEDTARVDWVAGASLMLRGRMLDRIGLFDETFFLYFEETDLCLRAAREGWHALYVPQSEAEHLGSVSTGMQSWARTPGYWYDSRLHYYVQNHGRMYAVAATLSRAVGETIWRLRCGLENKSRRDPPGFLRDLLMHGARCALRCRSRRKIRLADGGPGRNDSLAAGDPT
ncbi:Glycosyltransferase, GT2 family [Roseovarius nanhaiticus]|uniref:Glycosyltransferase, GT2 family n=1 Tax=Roseovarius nanhaiticus TaxID=573024 RepID=A0A1N7HJ04_9RHOB|nr:glycosyltransferase family 2 protein [Roseovarius nanhaiticus]SEK91721.1 Glycosyltransferase, GT2 family [Roseovarius nanhaiticus]SIS24711.1 Glycosyltransferase, GT2 family [Roseovarius nanhaiticus]